MRESVRSGRKANFYITENSFIDHYAREVGPVGIAVYHVLERHMNCETRSTWIGTAKMAALLNLSQRTVQRSLKTLEELRLIRILRTATMTTYVIVPVPLRAKMATIPLFDDIPDQTLRVDDNCVARATAVSLGTTSVSQVGDSSVAQYKEEQNLFNKTFKQDEVVSPSSYKSATQVIAMLGLPATDNNLRMVEAALVAEAAYTGQSVQEAAELITKAASEDRRRGILINKFYFEDAKWRQDRRSNVRFRISKAEQRKLDNLEINARVKQRFKDRFGSS
jgi:replication initiation and membrane attachment protein DnaB